MKNETFVYSLKYLDLQKGKQKSTLMYKIFDNNVFKRKDLV